MKEKNIKISKRLEAVFSINRMDRLEIFCKKTELSKSAALRLFMDYFLEEDKKNHIFNRDINFKKELIYELRRYGNNINQIAYKLNVALKIDQIAPSDKLEIKEAINKIDMVSKTICDLNNLINKRL